MPQTPINLISVSALTENGMYIGFRKNKTTCYFSKYHKSLSSLLFQADIIGCLSFLNCTYITPNENASANTILPFQKPELNAYLWHCQAGHPSQETTKSIVTGKVRVKGVTWNGKAPHEYCPSCIIGKCQQAPFNHNANRTTTLLELLHMDTCGPMPVKTPQKQEYFFAILDDCTLYNNADLMAKKNEVTRSFKDTQAKWENQTDEKVKKV